MAVHVSTLTYKVVLLSEKLLAVIAHANFSVHVPCRSNSCAFLFVSGPELICVRW